VIPTLNEEPYIRPCLESVLRSDYPLTSLEVLVVDGGSTDRTREIVKEIGAVSSCVRLLSNPKRITSAAMNVGIAEAAGRYVIRMDAHSLFPPEYVSHCVNELRSTGASNVGGCLTTRPGRSGLVAEAISLITTHRFGVGGSCFRLGLGDRFVDTVPFGAFCRETLLRVGGYREDLVRHEDYELNARIRCAGEKIYLANSIQNTYFQRPTLSRLLGKSFQDGYWLPKSWIRYPYCFRLRHAVPLAFVVILALLAGTGFLFWQANAFLTALVVLYVALSASVSLNLARNNGYRYLPILPWMFFLFHAFYGLGSVAGLASESLSMLGGDFGSSRAARGK
jgi:glycosyltransferase involved in cell wall biosynthesis